jgi:hypothetical protein
MKRALSHFFILALILATLSMAANPVAIMIRARGQVDLKNRTAKLKRGTRLQDGDKVVTGKKGSAAIKFLDDASLVRIRPNSTCVINTEKEQGSVVKNIYVEVGTIFSRVTKQKSKYRVSTPTSVASVKGTKFWTKQEFKGATWYFGEEGVIEISNDAGSALVKEGETGYVSSRTAKPIVRKTKEGEKPNFGLEDEILDEFEFEFENEQGQNKILKFKVKKTE